MVPRIIRQVRLHIFSGLLVLFLACSTPTVKCASIATHSGLPTARQTDIISSLNPIEATTSPGTEEVLSQSQFTSVPRLLPAPTGSTEAARPPPSENGRTATATTSSRATRSTTLNESTGAKTGTSATTSTTGSALDTKPVVPSSTPDSHEPRKSKFIEDFKATIKHIMSTMGSGLARRLLQADISAECSLGVLKFMRAVQELEPWALRLVDSTAKYPNGMLQASTADLGAYDECIETVVHDEYGDVKVRGQYCNVHVSLGDDHSFIGDILPAFLYSHKRAQNFTSYVMDQRLPGLRLGVCFVSSCSAQDLTNIARTLMGNVAKIVVKNCVTNEYEAINATQAWIIGFLAVLAAVIVSATGFELLTENWDKSHKKAFPYRCAVAFSALSNTRLILSVNKDENSETYSYRFMHGIRFLSIFWICLGHSYGTITENITRLVNALHYFERWETLIVTAGYLAVDSFFFFSGFLLYYTLNKQKRNRVVVAVVAIIRRYIRATVPLFFMIMCMYLLPLIATGPNSKEFYNRFYAEIRKHWWDLLFQMRNWRADEEVSTMPHLWYLSADYQFFLVAVVIIQMFKARKWLIAIIFSVLSIVSCGIAAWQIYGTNMTPFLVALANEFGTVMDTLNHYYMLPFYHGVCFFSGCLTFLLVERYGKAKISKMIQASLWCICLFCGLYCLFMKIEWYRSSERASETKRMFYAFTDRIFWSICVAWFVFTCATGRGGIVNRFLSWNGFVPLSRLSFGVYLIHSPFYILMYHIARERVFFSHFTLVSQCFAVMVWSYILSYFLFIACDAPTGHLEKLVFMPERRKEPSRVGVAANGVQHNSNNNAKDLPVGIIEEGPIKNYFSGAVPPSLGGTGLDDGCCVDKSCRL
ncbi:nose resistant to fluoxetine protein 6-like [Dermacentor andersoni]|uniref:nose resistant to fluoxetine protein 6-like n=1 Tax=Dermacentor andersoni TaxID=34620 RepID=UPI002155F065|nr:nose resistant to fluoxetine protein 6-like [Dermacentor andersoni]